MYKHYGLLLKEKRGIEEEEAHLSKHNDKIKLLSVEDSSSLLVRCAYRRRTARRTGIKIKNEAIEPRFFKIYLNLKFHH